MVRRVIGVMAARVRDAIGTGPTMRKNPRSLTEADGVGHTARYRCQSSTAQPRSAAIARNGGCGLTAIPTSAHSSAGASEA